MNAGFKTGGRKNIRFRKKRKGMSKLAVIVDVDDRVTVLDTPIKSQSDKKVYRTIRLENGLTALLVSDPSTATAKGDRERSAASGSEDDEDDESESGEEESQGSDGSGDGGSDSDEERGKCSKQLGDKVAACALCVKIGSFSDPPEVQGLAHFVEHMVFMGSKKYPVENDFDAFIRKRGGNDNAQTDCEHTTFYFEVEENHFGEAMDRFAQFFVAPLMKKEAMQREREAIESEFSLAVPSEESRKEQLICETFPLGHPLRRFMWGNNKSLTYPFGPTDEQLYKSAHNFRQRYYSAHNMTVAVQARLPLETLEKFVINTFGQIPTNNLMPDDISSHSFSLDAVSPLFKSFYYVKPVLQTTTLTLTWCMKSFQNDFKSKPNEYVSWIVGHQGTGSLIQYLRRKVWALNISSEISGGIENTSIVSMFSILLILTREGFKNLDRVLDSVFGYLNMLKKNCPNERIFQEMRKIEEINFKFKEDAQPADNVEFLAENMQYLPPEYYMTGHQLYFEYDPEGIKYVVQHMSPDYVNIMLRSQNYPEPIEYDQAEEWFGTKYKRISIEPDAIERWKNMEPDGEFHLPEPNPFIPDNFDLIEAPPCILELKKTKLENMSDLDRISHLDDELKLQLLYPSLIIKTRTMQVWHKPDFRFDLPHTSVGIFFTSPLISHSPKYMCLLDIWCATVNQMLTEKLFAAEITGLSKSLYVQNVGVTLKLYGYSQKLPIVLDEVTQMFLNYNSKLTEELFVALKEVQIKYYTNTIMKPSKLAKDIRLSMLMNIHWTTLEKLKAIQDVSFEDLQEFGEKFTQKMYIRMLMQGNLLRAEALQMSKIVEKNLNCSAIPEEERCKSIVHQLPLGERHCRLMSFNTGDETSVIINYYQFGISDTKSICIMELLMLMMEEPLFDTLRTKEQLGYNVHCSLKYTDGILGFTITVHFQAKKFRPEYVDSRIEKFLKGFLKDVKKMSKTSFAEFKMSLIKIKNNVDVELKDEIERNWEEIMSKEYQFDKLITEVKCVQALDLNEVKSWFDELLKSGRGTNFRKLSIQIVGHETKELLGHVDKKAKLGDELLTALRNRDYAVDYLEDPDAKVEFVKDPTAFSNSMICFREVKGTLPPQSDS